MGVSQLLYMYVISLNNMVFNNNHEKLKHVKNQQYESMYTKIGVRNSYQNHWANL